MDLTRTVAQTLDISEDVVDRVMTEYSKIAIMHMVFVGPVDTIYGRLGFSNGRIEVAAQSVATLKLVNSKPSKEELLESISDLLLEKTDDPAKSST
jgi:hypothetical protein